MENPVSNNVDYDQTLHKVGWGGGEGGDLIWVYIVCLWLVPFADLQAQMN